MAVAPGGHMENCTFKKTKEGLVPATDSGRRGLECKSEVTWGQVRTRIQVPPILSLSYPSCLGKKKAPLPTSHIPICGCDDP